MVTSAGGKDVVNASGHYRIEAHVPLDSERVQVTAVGSRGRNLAASANVGVSPTSGSVAVDPLSLVLGSTCSPSWLPTFGEAPGTSGAPGSDGSVHALAVYDDGGGPALYAGGDFASAIDSHDSYIASGAAWTRLHRYSNARRRSRSSTDP